MIRTVNPSGRLTLPEIEALTALASEQADVWWRSSFDAPTAEEAALRAAFARMLDEAVLTGRVRSHNARYKAGMRCPLECFCQAKARKKAEEKARE